MRRREAMKRVKTFAGIFLLFDLGYALGIAAHSWTTYIGTVIAHALLVLLVLVGCLWDAAGEPVEASHE